MLILIGEYCTFFVCKDMLFYEVHFFPLVPHMRKGFLMRPSFYYFSEFVFVGYSILYGNLKALEKIAIRGDQIVGFPRGILSELRGNQNDGFPIGIIVVLRGDQNSGSLRGILVSLRGNQNVGSLRGIFHHLEVIKSMDP